MKTITFDSPHRRKHFEFFRSMELPHFSITAPVEVGKLLEWLGSRPEHRFTVAVAFLISRAANAIPQLRWRIRSSALDPEDASASAVASGAPFAIVVEHEKVHPSFAVPTDEADVFSFCEVPFVESFAEFSKAATIAMEARRTSPSFEDAPGRDDYLFLSPFPWVAFSSVTQPMRIVGGDSVPRIVWGKHAPLCKHADADERVMPVCLQAHHAVVDGRHAGRFYELLEQSLLDPDAVLGSGSHGQRGGA